MFTRKAITGFGAVVIVGGLVWAFGLSHSPAQSGSDSVDKTPTPKKATPAAKPLMAQAPRGQARPDPNQPPRDFVEDDTVIHNCHLNVLDKVEVSAQREGIVLFVGRPAAKGEKIPSDHFDTYSFAGKTENYRKLKEGDIVEIDQVLAQVDNRLALDEQAIKEQKQRAAEADLVVSEKTRDEANARYDTQKYLFNRKSTSNEELRAAKLAVDKYVYEVVSKKAAIDVAKAELNQTKTVVELHEIRSKIRGQVKKVYKYKGEGVKNLDPILLIHNLDKLRAEGVVDTQYLPNLTVGMPVLVEHSDLKKHHGTFIGHLQPVTGVAVSKDSRNIVSVSEDGTARIWERGQPRERRIINAGVGLRSVACTPKSATNNYCLVGATDGTLRLYDLDADSDKPMPGFDDKHHHSVDAIAFNKDGTICASGGFDQDIRVWDVASGQLKFKLTGHHGPITSLQFTPEGQLVSASKDNSIMLWSLKSDSHSADKIFPKRSGYVPVLGISPDGKRVLYDPSESKSLRVLSLPEGLHEGIIRNASNSPGIKGLALFSPDGRFVLAGEGSEFRLQLWTAPTESSRSFEVCKMAMNEPSTVTCAAFAPDGSFVVAGTKDRQVLAWGPLPSEKEVANIRIPAVISNIDRSIDPGRSQVRIFAEFSNPQGGKEGLGLLMPGDVVNLVIPAAK